MNDWTNTRLQIGHGEDAALCVYPSLEHVVVLTLTRLECECQLVDYRDPSQSS